VAQIRHRPPLAPARDCEVGPWPSCVTLSKTDVAQCPSAAAPPEERVLRRISSFFIVRQNLQPWLIVVCPKLLNGKTAWTLTCPLDVLRETGVDMPSHHCRILEPNPPGSTSR